LSGEVAVTIESSASAGLDFEGHRRLFKKLAHATRDERRSMLEKSVAEAAPDYTVDQEWINANLDGSDR